MCRTQPRWRLCSVRSRASGGFLTAWCTSTFAGKEGSWVITAPQQPKASLVHRDHHSLAPLCRHAKPLFNEKAGVVTLTYLGAERAIPNYNVMGVAKAALEASVRYLSAELGPDKQVRVNAISAGRCTLASSAIGGILDMIHNVEEKAPLRRTVTQTEVGNTAAFLLSELSSGISGQTLYVDAGYCINGM